MALDLGIFLEGAESTNKVKVSDNDTQPDYLINKFTSSDASVTITETNDGGVETIDLTVGGSSDTNIANTDLTSDGNRTYDLNGNTQTFSNGKVIFSSTDNGILINRVTTAQMNAISSPSTNELVFNTDLEGLYRYDGSNWVALSAGYGVFELFSEGGSGIPTYFATFESALNETKVGDLHHTIKFYDNYEATSQIDITATNGYDFKSLTIDLNGFKLYNHQANGDDLLTFNFENNSAEKQELVIINGYLERLNATANAYTLYGYATFYGAIKMSNVTVYNDTYNAGYLYISSPSNEYGLFNDLGGSKFICGGNNNGIWLSGNYKNFTGISLGNSNGVYILTGNITNFYGESKGSGHGVFISGATIASHFTGISNSGIGLMLDNDNHSRQCSHFVARSQSNYAINASYNNDKLSHFDAYSASGIYAAGFNNSVKCSFGEIVAGSGIGAFVLGSELSNCNITSLSGNYALIVRENNKFTNCTFTAESGMGADIINFGGVNNSKFSNCSFISDYNNALGHALDVDSLGGASVYLMNCTFSVVNASANAIYSGTAQTVNADNCSHNQVATTPVNANVTVNSTGGI
jgi:hypothetical protein